MTMKNNFLPLNLVSNLQQVLNNRKGDGEEANEPPPPTSTSDTTETTSSTEIDESKPIVLVTNGDGIDSLGLTSLVKALVKDNLYNIQVFAPQSDRSVSGHSVTVCKTITVSSTEISGVSCAEYEVAGQSFCMSQIEELCANSGMIDSNEQIQNIVLFLSWSDGVGKLVDSCIQMVSLLEMKNRTPLILSPLLNSDDTCEVNSLRQLDLFYESSENDFDDILVEIEKEISMTDIVKELGYGCTVNSSHCKDILSLFLPLTEVTVSRILTVIARTHVGLEDWKSTHSTFCFAAGINSFANSSSSRSWNVDVLVESIKQLAPDTNWVHVMENLDHDGFYFPSEDSFSFFMSVYTSAYQDPFPLYATCGSVWNNAEGQIYFLRYAVSASPVIFTFVHSSRQLVYVDAVHGHKLSNENQAWLCLDMLDVLCQLAEAGHAGSVRSMLEYPLKHCLEVLLLGLSQTNVHFLYKGTLRVLLMLLHVFPGFLCNYHSGFCDVIQPSCIQMRNVILSAFPRNTRLLDPSTPNLKVVTRMGFKRAIS